MAEDAEGKRHDRNALILYGSETGNSEDAAEDLGSIAERLHFETGVCEMNLVEINELLNYSFVVFVISTTGQGELPRNARKFWKSLLRKRLPPGCLSHVPFTTFGLGDSSYPKFNFAARKLHKRLQQLGANEIYPRGESDEQHPDGIEGTFLPWSVDFRKHLLSLYPLPEGVERIPREVFLPPKFYLALVGNPEKNTPAINKDQTNNHSQDLDTNNLLSSRETPLTLSESSRPPSHGIWSSHDIKTNHHSTSSDTMSMNLTFKPTSCPEPPEHPEPTQHLTEHGDGPTHVDDDTPPAGLLPIPHAFTIQLVENKRITPEGHWQDVRLLTFNMPTAEEYVPGHTLTIYPKNFPADVDKLIKLMGWEDMADQQLEIRHITFKEASEGRETLLDKVMKTYKCYKEVDTAELPPIRPMKGVYPVARYPTLRQVLLHNLDITAIPKRSFFDMMFMFTDNETHKERLQEFANPAYNDEFFDYATRPRRSILEVLEDFPSVKFPYEYATHIFPVIRGRQFSICSGPLASETTNPRIQKVELLVALVKYQTVIKRVRQGLCSRYIASLAPGTCISTIIDDNFEFLMEPKRPIIMIAPGTGVAPCRSIIWDHAEITKINESRNEVPGGKVLFFGNRNKKADFFFADEWKDDKRLDVQVFTAFSRDQKQKIYVQDVIREQGVLVARLLLEDAVVVVCGSSGRMPLAVREALLDVLEEHGKAPFERNRTICVDYLKRLEKDGGYIQETW